MKERYEYILYLLSNSDGPMRTSELAEQISVSARTVKAEMQTLKSELPQHGAMLIARRNYGYALKILDEARFRQDYGPAFLRFSVTKRYSKYDFNQVIAFCRHLVSLTGSTTMEALSQHYSMSESNLRNYMSRAKPYLAGFHLSLQPHARSGIRVIGTEAHLRVALTELCAVHFHLASFDEYGAAYRRWLQCPEQERSELRHLLLRCLRESPLSLRDTNSQRLSIYLIIARNRNQAGYRLQFSPQELSDIQNSSVYAFARDIYCQIAAAHPGFETSEEEICFFCVLLLCYQDLAHRPLQESFAPFLSQEAGQIAARLQTLLREQYGLTPPPDGGPPYLESLLLPILTKRRFGMEGLTNFMWQYENKVRQSPVSMEIARCLTEALEEILSCSLALADTLQLANFVYLLLAHQRYEVRKQNLILVCDGGIWLGSLLTERLCGRYPELIGTVTTMELYEARRIDFKDYDAVIMDIQSFGYRYPLPWKYLSILPDSDALKSIYESILLQAYQFRDYLPDASIIHVFPDADSGDADSFYAGLARRHARDDVSARCLTQHFSRTESLLSGELENGSLFLFGDRALCAGEAIELYCFRQPLRLGESKVQYVLYMCLDWGGDPRKVKAMENCLFMLRRSPEYFQQFQSAPEEIFAALLEDYLKLE